IRAVLLGSGLFGVADATCVDEMFAETWEHPRPDGYRWLVAEQGQAVVGFACYGPESLTQDTWDLFWICVLPSARRRGVGRALLGAAMEDARANNARLMVIYTSSTSPYAPARQLYTALGFTHVATVPDYYCDGDDLNIYWKRLR
ncbi:MAG: GNAT family N-acetyltransferase, partial [Thermoflexales bacterium]|nr:GNAT family N-acetyltransferase [Thermoflexales bacterium]